MHQHKHIGQVITATAFALSIQSPGDIQVRSTKIQNSFPVAQASNDGGNYFFTVRRKVQKGYTVECGVHILNEHEAELAVPDLGGSPKPVYWFNTKLTPEDSRDLIQEYVSMRPGILLDNVEKTNAPIIHIVTDEIVMYQDKSECRLDVPASTVEDIGASVMEAFSGKYLGHREHLAGVVINTVPDFKRVPRFLREHDTPVYSRTI
tara:strand:+ start:2089 stop:2706 length:618 start_codon:yes stop_codon:yes gene_type:complete